jgi:exodeoxyribonuclease V alpha subunit
MRKPYSLKPLTLNTARGLGHVVDLRAGRYCISGEVRSIYQSSTSDGSWTVGALALTLSNQLIPFTAKGVGGLQVGRIVDIEGFWTRHPEYGVQLSVETCRSSELPRERRALVRYMSANIPGLGDKRSERVVRVLGESALTRLWQNPDTIKSIFPGSIGERITISVRDWARDQESDRWSIEIAPKLMAAGGVGYPMAKRIVSFFSSAEVADLIARRDPYRLLDVPGIGWARADAIAQYMGVTSDAEERLEAAILWAYRLGQNKGHTALTRSSLISSASRLIPGKEKGLSRALVRCTVYCELIRSAGAIFRPDCLQAEWTVADLINLLLRRKITLGEESCKIVQRIIEAERLNQEQGQAILNAVSHGVSIITGGPGTGKTFTLRALARVAQALQVDLRIVAPTGKAAVRASDVCGVRASTIHKLLGGSPGSLREQGPLTSGIFIMDEASMIDLELMAWLAKNIRPDNSFRLVFVGDHNQIPPIGHGKVLADLLEAGKVPTTTLLNIRRQAADSTIITQARRVIENKPLLEIERIDWRFVELPGDAQKAQRELLRNTRRVIQEEFESILRRHVDVRFEPTQDLQVLSPRRTGLLGVAELNKLLRDELNDKPSTGPWIGGGERVRVRDRVVCIQNDYTVGNDGLMNGEQGVVVNFRDNTIQVRLDDGRLIETRGVQNTNLELAFCTSIHRSQGSEYPVVVIVYHSSHYPLLDARLLYTAITRAKQRVILCADRRGLEMAASKGVTPTARITRLAKRISEEVNEGCMQ